MSSTAARLLLATSLLVLVALAGLVAFWPDREPRADLAPVKPASTTATTAPPSAASPSSTIVPAPVAEAPGVPTRLRIPAVGIDAPIVTVGLAPDGQMEVPPAAEVGWYRLGPRPGQPGSAVLAAHVDQGGRRGAFFDLRSVPEGAEVIVEGAGTSSRFVVSTREQIAKAEVDLSRYFTAEGPTRLTLITCGGAFDRGVGHYDDNVILTAVPVG